MDSRSPASEWYLVALKGLRTPLKMPFWLCFMCAGFAMHEFFGVDDFSAVCARPSTRDNFSHDAVLFPASTMETNMTLLTRRNALKLGLAGTALMARDRLPRRWSRSSSPAATSRRCRSPFPISPRPIRPSGAEIAEIVRDNLQALGPVRAARSGVAAGAGRRRAATTPDFAAWRAATVDALVMGPVERGGQIQSSVRVWDTQAAAQVVGKSYSTDPQNYRRIAHIVSDAIYASLSGGTGYFDTRIALSSPRAAPRPTASSGWRSWTRTAPTCST